MKDPLIILIVILVIVIIVRGPKTLPAIGNMLGRGVKQARKEADEIKTDMRKDKPATDAAVVAPTPAPGPVTAVAQPVAPAPPPVAPIAPPPPPAPPGAAGPA